MARLVKSHGARAINSTPATSPKSMPCP